MTRSTNRNEGAKSDAHPEGHPPQVQPRAPMTAQAAVAAERHAFAVYTDAIGRTVGHDASAKRARAACPPEYAAWVNAYSVAYGASPS